MELYLLTKLLRLTAPIVTYPELEKIWSVLKSGWLTEGPVTTRFEEEVAKYVGAKYAVAVCNCTVALELCLKAYDIRGEVVIPDFTHYGTACAVVNAGATPVLCDVDLKSYNVQTTSSIYYEAGIPVSWAGNPSYCMGTGPQLIIEDAACSLGAGYGDYKTGSVVTTCFSFHPRKLVTSGEGGMVTTNDEEIANKIRELKHFEFPHGGNYKISDVLSALGLTQLAKIKKTIARRIEMAEIYNELLSEVPHVKPPQKHPLAKHVYQTYAVYLEKGDRDKIRAKMAEKNIETQIGTYALHLTKGFENVKRIGSLENSTKLYHHLLSLPMASTLTDEDQKRVVYELKQLIA